MQKIQLKNLIYLLRFGHTRALLFKKKGHEMAIFPVLGKLTHMRLYVMTDSGGGVSSNDYITVDLFLLEAERREPQRETCIVQTTS